MVSTALLLQGLLTDPVAAAMAEQEQGGEEDAYSSVASGGSMDEGVRGAVGVEGAAAAAGAGAGAGEGAGGPVVDLERVGTGPGGSGGGGASYQLREEVEEVEGSSAGEERLGGVSGVGAEEGQGKGEGKGRGKGEAGLGSLEAREVDPKFMSFSDDEELSWRLMTGGAAGGGPGGYRWVGVGAGAAVVLWTSGVGALGVASPHAFTRSASCRTGPHPLLAAAHGDRALRMYIICTRSTWHVARCGCPVRRAPGLRIHVCICIYYA